MNDQAKIPNLEVRQRHVINAKAACQELQAFTAALDGLIAQLESEIERQTHHDGRILMSEGVNPL